MPRPSKGSDGECEPATPDGGCKYHAPDRDLLTGTGADARPGGNNAHRNDHPRPLPHQPARPPHRGHRPAGPRPRLRRRAGRRRHGRPRPARGSLGRRHDPRRPRRRAPHRAHRAGDLAVRAGLRGGRRLGQGIAHNAERFRTPIGANTNFDRLGVTGRLRDGAQWDPATRTYAGGLSTPAYEAMFTSAWPPRPVSRSNRSVATCCRTG